MEVQDTEPRAGEDRPQGLVLPEAEGPPLGVRCLPLPLLERDQHQAAGLERGGAPREECAKLPVRHVHERAHEEDPVQPERGEVEDGLEVRSEVYLVTPCYTRRLTDFGATSSSFG